MSDDKIDQSSIIEGHNYDGITELNNPMPDWWLWTFIFTVMFSALYYIHYEFGGAPTLKEELTESLAVIAKNKSNSPEVGFTEEELVKAILPSENLSQGQKVYLEKCAACHGVNLEGLIGPNLTDKFWLHGKGLRLDIAKIIYDGVADKGMPAWGAMLSRNDIAYVTGYIHSKHGTNPPNAKAPQGEAVEP